MLNNKKGGIINSEKVLQNNNTRVWFNKKEGGAPEENTRVNRKIKTFQETNRGCGDSKTCSVISN